jgi:hypothetical protein
MAFVMLLTVKRRLNTVKEGKSRIRSLMPIEQLSLADQVRGQLLGQREVEF